MRELLADVLKQATRAGRDGRRRLRGGGPVVLGLGAPGPGGEGQARARAAPGAARLRRASRRRPPRPPISRASRSTRLVDEAVALARITAPTSCTPACPTPSELVARRCPTSTSTIPTATTSRPRRRSSWPGAARRPRSRPIRASPTPRAPSSATAAPATPTPRATASPASTRRRPSASSVVAGGDARTARCSATPGTTSTRKRARLDDAGGDRPHRGAARAAPPGRPAGQDRRGAGRSSTRRRRPSLVRHLAGAVAGPALYRRASFLLGKLGERIAAPGGHDRRRRHHPGRARLAAVRRRGAAGAAHGGRRARACCASYLLDTYAARKLGLPSTHHAARDGSGVSVSHDQLLPAPRATATRRT